MTRTTALLSAACACALMFGNSVGRAGDLVLDLKNAAHVTFVGAVNRWDADGNHRTPVNPKAKIDKPLVDAVASKTKSGKWVFKNLADGRYDVVILTGGQFRIEGFHYPPVLEFDAPLTHGEPPSKSAVDWITKDISKARHYENKVSPLYLSGDKKQVRVLMQLLRDKPTSFDGQFGEQVATLRHEVWQYSNRYGGFAKEKRTKVFDRVLMAKRELRQWTWIWEPKLGGIQIEDKTVTVTFEMPKRLDPKTAKGLLPY